MWIDVRTVVTSLGAFRALFGCTEKEALSAANRCDIVIELPQMPRDDYSDRC